ASPGASPSPAPQQGSLANPLPPDGECALRLFARLSHALVDGIQPPPEAQGQPGTQACPPANVLVPGTALAADPSPVTIDSTRIPMTIAPTSVADQAALVDSLMRQAASLSQPSSIV